MFHHLKEEKKEENLKDVLYSVTLIMCVENFIVISWVIKVLKYNKQIHIYKYQLGF